MARLLDRPHLTARIKKALRRSPITALLGPRQCGKTTLAKQIAKDSASTYFDLENPLHLARLEQPMSALDGLRGLIVIDEVQRRPDLFRVLRVLADRPRKNTRFLILGSASPELIRQGSETLDGRIAFVEMAGFGLAETGPNDLDRLWVRGGLPRSYLARSLQDSLEWRQDFVRTFLERDIRALGINVPAASLRRLWMMLAHYHGQVLNVSEIARSLGEGHTTVRRHIDVLSGALVARQLQPWFENLGKRQIKAPKIYVRDSGLLHALLGIRDMSALGTHPKLGASWEGFVIEQIVGQAGERNAYFWATQSGAELDLVLMLGTRRIGVEVKYADAPRATKSMAIALRDLKLDALYIVYPGAEPYRLNQRTEVLPCAAALEAIAREGETR
ncbi:MAG: ATP-binding protein [Betaproteobacteria bacterium]|nr:ATP-binding protein [Betaproteobacteria bacterium]